MMDDFVMATQFGIFVLERVETMRAGGDDLFDTVTIQHLNILVGHHLKQKFVPGPSGRVSCAIFLFAKYGIIDVHLIKDGRECFGHSLCTLVKTPRASYPKENLGCFSLCKKGRDDGNLHGDGCLVGKFTVLSFDTQIGGMLFALTFVKPCMRRILRAITDWEQWNFFVLYFPLMPVWLWYCLKSRSVWFFSASNPTLTFGGFEGEGKKEMYEQLPADYFPITCYLHPLLSIGTARDVIEQSGLCPPFVVKPDVGMKGILFRRIGSWQEWEQYHRLMPVEYMAQALVDHPLELSIFYYRHPEQPRGVISGCIEKELLQVTGNGRSSLGELVEQHPRASLRMTEMRHRHQSRWHHIVPDGELYYLSYAGNHNRGARFIDRMSAVDDTLLQFFDALSHRTSFYYGRYDIKCVSIEALKEGRDFSILEFNGCGAEPNHIYDAGLSLWKAYRILLQHWKALYGISACNNQRGHPYWSFQRGWTFLREARAHFARLEQLD